jgi:hypothetical protein
MGCAYCGGPLTRERYNTCFSCALVLVEQLSYCDMDPDPSPTFWGPL